MPGSSPSNRRCGVTSANWDRQSIGIDVYHECLFQVSCRFEFIFLTSLLVQCPVQSPLVLNVGGRRAAGSGGRGRCHDVGLRSDPLQMLLLLLGKHLLADDLFPAVLDLPPDMLLLRRGGGGALGHGGGAWDLVGLGGSVEARGWNGCRNRTKYIAEFCN